MNIRRKTIQCYIGTVISVFLICQSAAATSFQFTKIADSNSSVPGQATNFTGFSWVTPNGNGEVAFAGRTTVSGSSWDGIYRYANGSISLVADKSTIMPGSTDPFNIFLFNGALAFEGDKLAFGGFAAPFADPNARRGIYQYSGSSGTLSKVVDTTDPVPGVSGLNFFSIQAGQPTGPRLSNGHLVFTDRSWSEGLGAYAVEGGVPQIVANRSTPVPGGTGNFQSAFAEAVDRDGTVLFFGSDTDNNRGLFTRSGDTLSRIVDQATVIPGGSGTFEGMGYGQIDQGVVAFIGYGATETIIDASGVLYDMKSGIYNFSEDVLTKIIDVNDFVPDLSGNFLNPSLSGVSAFYNLAFHNGHTAFEAFVDPDDDPTNYNEYLAAFTDLGGSMAKLLAPGDLIDGKTVSEVYMSSEAMRNDEIALHVRFTDSMSAVYLVTAETTPVPEPAMMLLFGIGLVGLAAARRRKDC